MYDTKVLQKSGEKEEIIILIMLIYCIYKKYYYLEKLSHYGKQKLLTLYELLAWTRCVM